MTAKDKGGERETWLQLDANNWAHCSKGSWRIVNGIYVPAEVLRKAVAFEGASTRERAASVAELLINDYHGARDRSELRDLVGNSIRNLSPSQDEASSPPSSLSAAREMGRALAEQIAADDSMLAFLLVADAKQIGEAEWDRQHKERSERKRKALESARAALESARTAGLLE